MKWNSNDLWACKLLRKAGRFIWKSFDMFFCCGDSDVRFMEIYTCPMISFLTSPFFFSYFPFSSRVNKCNPSAPGCEHVSHSPILFRHTLGIIRTHSTHPQRVGPYWKIHGLFSTGDHSFTCTITGKMIHILDTSWKPSASCSKCQQPTSSTHLGVGISCTYVTDEPKSQKGVQDKHNNKLLWAFPPHFLTMLY